RQPIASMRENRLPEPAPECEHPAPRSFELTGLFHPRAAPTRWRPACNGADIWLRQIPIECRLDNQMHVARTRDAFALTARKVDERAGVPLTELNGQQPADVET